MVRSFILLFVLAAPLLACSLSSPERAPETLKLGIVSIPAYALIFLAEEEGLFVDAGVVLDRQEFATGRDALAVLLDGGLDLATVYTTPTLLATLSGEDIVAITSLHRSSDTTALVAQRSAGISTVDDLVGKRVGTTVRTSGDFFLEVYLAENGLRRDAVSIEDGSQAELVDRLLKGKLDAVALWSPSLLVASRTLGPNAVVFRSEVYEEMSLAVGTRERVAARHLAITRFLRALHRAEALAEERPERLAATFARKFPELTAEERARLLSTTDYHLELSHRLHSTLRQEAAWLDEIGAVRVEGVRVGDLIYPGPLRAVAPDSVTLLPSEAGE